ncbi:MAG: hypothetical protein NXI07_03800 [bacterium]|nr:hypothetical protein [bacterium]
MLRTIWVKHLGKIVILLLLIAYFSKSLTTATRHALREPFVQRFTHIKFDRNHMEVSTWSFLNDLGISSENQPVVQVINHLKYSDYYFGFPFYSTEAVSCIYSYDESGRSHQPTDRLTAAQDAEQVLIVLNEIAILPDWARTQENITSLLLSGVIERTRIEWLSLIGFSLRIGSFCAAIAFLWILYRRILMTNRSERWREAGCCADCGYRVQSELRTCPECGSIQIEVVKES